MARPYIRKTPVGPNDYAAGLEPIADELNITPQRVAQIQAAALVSLRRKLAAAGIYSMADISDSADDGSNWNFVED